MSGRDHSKDDRERAWAVSLVDAWTAVEQSDGVQIRCSLDNTPRTGVLYVELSAGIYTEDGYHSVARISWYWPNGRATTFLGELWAKILELEQEVEHWKRQRDGK